MTYYINKVQFLSSEKLSNLEKQINRFLSKMDHPSNLKDVRILEDSFVHRAMIIYTTPREDDDDDTIITESDKE
jgi:hypothetical protein